MGNEKQTIEERETPAPRAVQLLWSERDVAYALGVSPRTVRRLVDTDELPPPLRVGGMKRWRRSAIESWIEKRQRAARRGRPRADIA